MNLYLLAAVVAVSFAAQDVNDSRDQNATREDVIRLLNGKWLLIGMGDPNVKRFLIDRCATLMLAPEGSKVTERDHSIITSAPVELVPVGERDYDLTFPNSPGYRRSVLYVTRDFLFIRGDDGYVRFYMRAQKEILDNGKPAEFPVVPSGFTGMWKLFARSDIGTGTQEVSVGIADFRVNWTERSGAVRLGYLDMKDANTAELFLLSPEFKSLERYTLELGQDGFVLRDAAGQISTAVRIRSAGVPSEVVGALVFLGVPVLVVVALSLIASLLTGGGGGGGRGGGGYSSDDRSSYSSPSTSTPYTPSPGQEPRIGY